MGAKIDKITVVSYLLSTLPSFFDSLVTAIDTMDEENINIAFVKRKLLDFILK